MATSDSESYLTVNPVAEAAEPMTVYTPSPAAWRPAHRSGAADAGRWQRRLAVFVRLERRLYSAGQWLRADFLVIAGATSFLLQRALHEPSLPPVLAGIAATLALTGLVAVPVLLAVRRALLAARNQCSRRFYRAGLLLDQRDAQWTLTDGGSYAVIAAYPPLGTEQR